jgi:hypothetical protein
LLGLQPAEFLRIHVFAGTTIAVSRSEENNMSPKDEAGNSVRIGDLVLYLGEVFKVLDWRAGLAGHNLELTNIYRSNVGAVDSRLVVGLGDDTISGLKKGGQPRTEITQPLDFTERCAAADPCFEDDDHNRPIGLAFHVGDYVRRRSSGEMGQVVMAAIRTVTVEVWPARGGALVSKVWKVGECELSLHGKSKKVTRAATPSREELDEAFGGTFYRGESEGHDSRPSLVDWRIGCPRKVKEPEKKDSISKQDLINDEVRRLNKERRDKVMGVQPEEKKPLPLRTRKEQW